MFAATVGHEPLLLAGGVILLTFVVIRFMRWIMALALTLYVLVGAGSYITWLNSQDALGPSGYRPSLDTATDIVWHLGVAASAILGWPLWPTIRPMVLGS